MYASIRRYGGIEASLLDELARRRDEIEALVLRVPGLVAYSLIRTPEGLTAVTVCEDQDGAEESNTRVARWVAQNLGPLVSHPPDISGGEVLLHTGR